MSEKLKTHENSEGDSDTGTGTGTDDPQPFVSDRKALDIAVARARGWTVEPYVATSQYNNSGPIGHYDRYRLLDGEGKVQADWQFSPESAWQCVPQWSTMSAHRDELERHIAERFGELRISLRADGSVLCTIGRYTERDTRPYSDRHETSFEEKGVALCRAFLAACEQEKILKKKQGVQGEPNADHL